MHKGVKFLILGLGLTLGTGLAGCASAPTAQNFLNDAAATCGARDLFDSNRTYEMSATGDTINRTYTCVNAYLEHSPEYEAYSANPAADKQFINTMWQIEIARSKGLLTREQAQAQSRAAIAAHDGK